MFIRKICKKTPRYLSPNHILENDAIDSNKNFFLMGNIIFGNCRGHDTITIFFHFEGFYEQHVCLMSKNYYCFYFIR